MTHVLQNGHIMALTYHFLHPFCPHVQTTTDWCFDSIVVGVCAVGTFLRCYLCIQPKDAVMTRHSLTRLARTTR